MPSLDFKGKQHIYAHHLTVPYRSLIPDQARSHNPADADDNLIIHGDNLHALKALLPRYGGKVKCIYIDPPYNTGNEGWIYNDKTNSPLLKEWFQQNSPVDGEDLERHDKWLCMMWPRLQLLKELLADDGVIFVTIDDNEQQHLRMLMDEIFGENNFTASIIWHHRKSSQNDIDVSLSHNYILCYALDRSSFSFNAGDVDESKFSNPDDDPRGPWVADPMDAPAVRENLTYEIANPTTGSVYLPPEGRHWRFTEQRFNEALEDNRIVFGSSGNARPQYKRFLSAARERGTNIFTIWSDVGTATDATRELQRMFGRNQSFPTPKPTDLLSKIIRIATDENDIVLDSFAGSGTTAHAVLALNKEEGGNRKFILVECEEYADTITGERIRRVINGVPEARDKSLQEGLGGSFTYCTLGNPIDVEGMLTGKNLPEYSELAAYLLHVSAGVSAGAAGLQAQNDDGLFYSSDTTNYHLLYQPNVERLEGNGEMLYEDQALRIGSAAREVGKKAIVFGPGKYIGQRELSMMGITFCQLPYEISKATQ